MINFTKDQKVCQQRYFEMYNPRRDANSDRKNFWETRVNNQFGESFCEIIQFKIFKFAIRSCF